MYLKFLEENIALKIDITKEELPNLKTKGGYQKVMFFSFEISSIGKKGPITKHDFLKKNISTF